MSLGLNKAAYGLIPYDVRHAVEHARGRGGTAVGLGRV